MGIFNWNGAAGLPPLGDDDDQNASTRNDKQRNASEQRCPDCGEQVAEGFRFCWECSIRRVRNQKIQTAVFSPAAESEWEKLVRKSAPPFTADRLDERCYWCSLIKNEDIASPTGDDRILAIDPTVPCSRDRYGWLVPGYECKLHLARRLAYEDVNAAMQWMRDEGATNEQIADYYRYGYLGEG